MSTIEHQVTKSIEQIAALENDLPAIIIIHNIQKDFTVEFMSNYGQKMLNTTLKELKAMGLEYHSKYFNEEDAQDYIPKIKAMLEENDMDKSVTFFQQVRSNENEKWKWYFSSSKILLQDEKGLPLLTITHAVPIDPSNHVTKKVSRMLEEKNFMRENLEKYEKLSKRESEILKFIAQSKGNKEIAEKLFISVGTVESHKKNIKNKLDASSNTELNLYARAFDLI